MRKIVLSIQNDLLADALAEKLAQSGVFTPFPVAVDRSRRTVAACVACGADIVLMEVSLAACAKVNDRLREVAQIRQQAPDCKIVLLCDERVSPQIAQEVKQAKKDGRIDAFFYASLTIKYLVAALYAV